MPPRPTDLFADTTMSFGEHLEALRSHLWKAIAGVALGCIICLFVGEWIVTVIRYPLDKALEPTGVKLKDDTGKNPFGIWLSGLLGQAETPPVEPEPDPEYAGAAIKDITGVMTVEVSSLALLQELHRVRPQQFPAPDEKAADQPLKLTLASPDLVEMQQVVLDSRKPVALSVQEPFMIYLKVSGIAGLVLASPWVFYQVWQFIAAGLYLHERKYMHYFGALSLVLFAIGVVFCFTMVLPLVLQFLMKYNDSMGVKLEPRLSEYITFASILPLMFGIGFQLPLLMVFLERMNVVSIKVFTDNWRMSVFAIACISMLLTPPEPISMLMMMGPMVLLYFLGIFLCKWTSSKREVAAVPSV